VYHCPGIHAVVVIQPDFPVPVQEIVPIPRFFSIFFEFFTKTQLGTSAAPPAENGLAVKTFLITRAENGLPAASPWQKKRSRLFQSTS
jgi:hypothetical protein